MTRISRSTAIFAAGAIAAGVAGVYVSQAVASSPRTSPPTLSSIASTLEGDASSIVVSNPTDALALDAIAAGLNASPSTSELQGYVTTLDGLSSLPGVGTSIGTAAGELQTIVDSETTTASTTTSTITLPITVPTITLPTTPTTTTTGTSTTGTGTTKTTTTTTTTTTSGTGTGTTTTGTGASNLTPAQIAYFEFLVQNIEKLTAELKAAGTHSGYAVVEKVSRAANKLTVILGCTASSNRTCVTSVTASRGRRSVSKHVKITGGKTADVKLTVPKAPAGGPIKVTAKTGAVSTSKTLG